MQKGQIQIKTPQKYTKNKAGKIRVADGEKAKGRGGKKTDGNENADKHIREFVIIRKILRK